MEFGQKKFFREIDLFHFMSFTYLERGSYNLPQRVELRQGFHRPSDLVREPRL